LFSQTQWLPYGYHNFIYGWIDTPNGNFPPLLAQEFLPMLGAIIEHVSPPAAYKTFLAGLNKRMNV